MANTPISKKGKVFAEYPKLVMVASGKKVRVFNKAEEDALDKPEKAKDKAWGKNKE